AADNGARRGGVLRCGLRAAPGVAGAHDQRVVADREVELDGIRVHRTPGGELLAVAGDANAVGVGELDDADARGAAGVGGGRGVRVAQQLAAVGVVARDAEIQRRVVDALDGRRGQLREARVV